MKIRTDFVTNSSSSNFSLVLSVETSKGKSITFEEDPYEGDEGGGIAKFDRDLIYLAKDLCSGWAPESCKGSENQELDLTTGAFTKYAEYEWD